MLPFAMIGLTALFRCLALAVRDVLGTFPFGLLRDIGSGTGWRLVCALRDGTFYITLLLYDQRGRYSRLQLSLIVPASIIASISTSL